MIEHNLKDMLSYIDIPATWVGLREVKESTTYRNVRDMKPQGNTTENSHGIMVEVLVDGQFGYYGTRKFGPEDIRFAAEKAYEQAKLSAPFAIHQFNPDARPVVQGQYDSPFIESANSLSAGEICELLLNANQKLKISDKVVSVSSLAAIIETKFRYVSSNGSDVSQNFLMNGLMLSATGQDGNIIQKRSDSDKFTQSGLESFNKDLVMERCDKLGRELMELLEAEECPSVSTNLVINSDQMMLQIHESIGHALEVDRILGDERNYAGWSFVRQEDFGNLQYGSKLMNVTFDPLVENEFASYGYDDSGMKAEKEFIIKDGVLLRGLGGLESQMRTDIPGVANFRACSWNRAPIDRMANLNLEPGEHTFEEIIESIEYGVYMETNRSWSIDDYRNKFQFGCEYAKLIENGKLTKVLKNPNYRGVTTPFWNGLKMLGNKDSFGVYGTPFCGKGEPNQSIRVGHASPVCLFENVEVFGGA